MLEYEVKKKPKNKTCDFDACTSIECRVYTLREGERESMCSSKTVDGDVVWRVCGFRFVYISCS